ncbi:MAG: hypothetical protein R2806_25395 [Saprospiraceae bacterium]
MSVQLPQIIADLKVGESVFFDDGMIRGQVVAKNADEVELEITEAYKKKTSGPKKALIFRIPALNLPSDRTGHSTTALCLRQCRHIVGYSFRCTPEDAEMLYQERLL